MDLSTLQRRLRSHMPDTISDLRQRASEHAPEAAARREAGYTIRAAEDTTVIRVYDEIWFLGVNAEDFARDLDQITTPRIEVQINSPGGDVFDGIAIYNALRTHPAHVTTRVDGVAASIASVIAQAGDRRVVLSSGQMMVHNAWGVTIGDSQDHTDMAGLLDQQDDIIAGIYASRADGDRDHFRALMNAETWLSDERIVDEGLADEVVEPTGQSEPSNVAALRTAPTLHDEISSAVDAAEVAVASAERVAALRAESGKSLSNVNSDSLAGLRDSLGRLDELLATQEPSDLTAEYLRFVALTHGVAS